MSSLGLIILRRNYTREPVSTISIYWYFPSAGHSKINNSGISQSNPKTNGAEENPHSLRAVNGFILA